MSLAPGNLSSHSIAVNTQYRSDFIEKFKQRQDQNYERHNTDYPRKRWDYLHELSKLQQIKLEEQRQKAQKEKESNVFMECTFTPQFISSPMSSQGSVPTTCPNRLETEPCGLLGRQEAWNQKKCLRLETLKQSKNTQDFSQCNFKPKLNPLNKLNKSNINHVTSKVVEDPESFNLYVSRLEQKRKEDDAKRTREKSVPGSGNIWTSKAKRYNLNYDYTKHEQSRRSLSKKNSRSSLQKLHTPKTFSSNTITSIGNPNKRPQLNNKDAYYDYMYNSLREGKQLKDSKAKDRQSLQSHSTPLYNDKVEYGQAIELLHNELYSFPLMFDE